MEELYWKWLEEQRRGRTGESLRRLLEGHAFNEALFTKEIWLKGVGNLNYLKAEYEVPGFGEGYFYVDNAYLRPPYKVGWEIDDFKTHGQHTSRRTFEYERERQNHLVLNGWIIFRMPLDMIRDQPNKCRRFVQFTLGKLYGDFGETKEISLPLKQREIVRFANKLQRPFSPAEACDVLGIRPRHARNLLHEMTEQGWLEAASGVQRVRTYRLGQKGSYFET
ncbi:DNA-binding response regulator [Cohnella sp. GbtcB17]|uniref:DNA-binding response regulator n=1 Tax=Cohnella sp. GbtcB17 TaxID=2824762 RepID=UPI001C3079B1|nr:DNA-binding response regulator [Cohnella sp. GbtcB17]